MSPVTETAEETGIGPYAQQDTEEAGNSTKWKEPVVILAVRKINLYWRDN